jgi:ectoine hydroxylase-related dioxygenase (phytanoyl-CoA dioxygenase family)
MVKSSTDTPYFLRSSINHSQQSPAIKNEGIHVAGYQVIRGAIEIDERVLTGVQNACVRKIGFIFNHNEMNPHNDHKRRQRNLPLRTQYMLKFDESVKQIVQSKINTDLTPTDPVIIHSRPGCQPQAAHCDYLPDEALKVVSDKQMPLAALICLMPKTRLKVWPNSSRLATSDPALLSKVQSISCQEVELNPGDMIIFRGDFVHAGSGYETDNYRIHYYLDSPLVPRVTNRTWLINKSGSEELRRIIQPASNNKLSRKRPFGSI